MNIMRPLFAVVLSFMATHVAHAQYYDQETGFYYNGHRYYDPATGQFTQPDRLDVVRRAVNPLYAKYSEPTDLRQTLNQPYTYVDNNPLKFTDPLGLIKWTGTGVSAGIKNAGKTRYTLVSDCVGGYQTEVVVDADLYSFGAGASWTTSAATFTDNFDYVNPYVFDGPAFNVSAGMAAGWGAGFDFTTLGGAGSPGGWSAQKGNGAWAGVGVGRSKVISSRSIACSCPSK